MPNRSRPELVARRPGIRVKHSTSRGAFVNPALPKKCPRRFSVSSVQISRYAKSAPPWGTFFVVKFPYLVKRPKNLLLALPRTGSADVTNRPCTGLFTTVSRPSQRPSVQPYRTDETPAEGRRAAIGDLYRKHLHREAEVVGLDAFVRALDAGASLDDVKAAVVGPDEYFQHRGGGTHDGFVRALYQDMLGRDADTAGAAGWVAHLAKGGRATKS